MIPRIARIEATSDRVDLVRRVSPVSDETFNGEAPLRSEEYGALPRFREAD